MSGVDGDGPGASRRLTWRDGVPYVVGWGVVAALAWGAGRVSGWAHVLLIVVEAVLALYLLFLGIASLLMLGIVGVFDGWFKRRWSGRGHREIPVAWWIVIWWWVVGVLGACLIVLFGLGVRGSEARWLIADYLVPGIAVVATSGLAGWRQRRAAARLPAGESRHVRRAP